MPVEPVTRFRNPDDLVARGWGVMRRSGSRWMFVPHLDQGVNIAPVVGKVHRRVAPLAVHLLDWLVAGRGRALDQVGNWGGAVRPIRGRERAAYAGDVNAWSNHAGLIALDIEAPRNPLGATGRGDFPPGWEHECHRCGFAWGAATRVGGDYSGRPDRMHIEFVGTPEQADLHVAQLADPGTVPAPGEDDPMALIPIRPDENGVFHEAAMCEAGGGSPFGERAAITLGSTWGSTVVTVTALNHLATVLQQWPNLDVGNNGFWAQDLPDGTRIVTVEGTVQFATDATGRPATRMTAAIHTRARR